MRTIIIMLLATFTLPSLAQTWIIDKNGCKIHNPNPRKDEAVVWTGDCSDSIAEGNGTLTWYLNGKPTNNVYTGEMINGRPHGNGKYQSSESFTLEGKFENGFLKYGTRIEILSNGSMIYIGDFENNYLVGYGEIIYKDVYRYIGETKNEIPNGTGKQILENTGDTLEGKFINGNFTQGRLTLSNGIKYTGKFNGYEPINGTIEYTDSTIYKGEIKNYEPHGEGILYLSDGVVFKCSWKKNTPHGQGEYKFPNGRIYKAKWVNGILQGKGLVIHPDGTTTEAKWKNGEFEK